MSKYCAEDLRNAAEDVENYSGYDEDIIADMLRFAADVLGREKRYEYGLKSTCNGEIHVMASMEVANKVASDVNGFTEMMRREVGAWEEVKDV